jgi:TRAP-type C4-dicarboxylate transport system permease small subunit
MRILLLIDRLFGLILGLLVVVLMVITFVDVMLRTFFDAPLSFAPELTVVGLAALVYIGLPVVSAREEHITISLFENLFKGRAQRIKKTLIALLLAFLCGALSYQLWVHGGKLGIEFWLYLGLEKYWVAYAMSVLAAMTAVVFLLRAVINFRGTGDNFEGHTDLSSSAGS